MSSRWAYFRKTPWLVALSPFVLGGLAFMGVPWFTMYTITCDRNLGTHGQCQIWQSLIFLRTHDIPMETLQGATTQSRYGGRGSSHWVILQTHQGPISLPATMTSEPPDRVAGKLNTFLSRPQEPRLRVSQGEHLYGLGVGFCLWCAGGLTLWLTSIVQKE